jgi:hypothetical protein
MTRDPGRERQPSEVASRGALPPGEVKSSGGGDDSFDVEFDAPTRPRARRDDSEAPAEPRASVSLPAHRGAQDSFQPVRVPAQTQTVRPPLSLWTRAWATTALVIVVAGGAIGIVAGLRLRTFGLGERSPQTDGSPAVAVQDALEHRTETKGVPNKAAAPAAAAAFTAPSPLAPVQAANRNVATVTSAVDTLPIASSPGPMTVRASPSVVSFRTPESLAISPVAQPSAQALPVPRHPKPTPTIAPTTARTRPPDESAHVPTPAPAPSDPPETKGESEAWVTEERRF